MQRTPLRRVKLQTAYERNYELPLFYQNYVTCVYSFQPPLFKKQKTGIRFGVVVLPLLGVVVAVAARRENQRFEIF